MRIIWIKSLVAVPLLLFSIVISAPALAQTFEPGHKALQLWNAEAMDRVPPAVEIWLYFMMAVLVTGLLFVWRHRGARWIVLGTVGIVLSFGFLVPALGMTPFTGLAALTHLIFWSPGLYILLRDKPFLTGVSPYAIWSGLATFMIVVSFFFDIRDAAIYLDYMAGLGLLS